MANGMDMLVNTLLKAAGYSKEDLDKGIATAKTKFSEFDARFVALETNVGKILALLESRKEGEDNAADVPRVEVSRD